MKPPILKKWHYDKDLEMLLLFAHVLEELLFDYTVDSYKAKALNIHSSLHELDFFAHQLLRNKVKSGALIPVIEEFEEKLKIDPVIEEIKGSSFNVYLNRLKQYRKDPEMLISITQALKMELGRFYWEALLKAIETNVKIENNSKKIISLANTFIAEAELHGFHRRAIYHFVRKHFWRNEINSIDSIKSFLDRFKEDDKKYSFIFRATVHFSEISDFVNSDVINISDSKPTLKSENKSIISFLSDDHTLPLFITIADIKAKDPVHARQYAENMIERLADIYSLHYHSKAPKWSSPSICIEEEDGIIGFFKPPTSPLKKKKKTKDSPIKDQINRTVEIFSGLHLNSNDTRVFHKALEFHRAALETNTPENQLVDLWATLEGFLPTPDGSSDRISHYVATLVPSISLSYAEKLFKYNSDSVRLCDKKITDLINSLEIEGDFFEKFVCLIVSNEMDEKRNELYTLLSKNPLLRFRCFTLNKQFKSTKKIHKTISLHKHNVSLHIQRIYSTRNQIVHEAESLPYLPTLVENLHNYIDLLIESITKVITKSKVITSIDGGVKLMSVQEQAFLQDLEGKNEECSNSNFKNLIFGSSNPVSPYTKSFSIRT